MPPASESEIPVLETARLILRPPRDGDAPALRDYYVRNDERFAPWREARSHDVDEHVLWIAAHAGPGSDDDVAFLAFHDGAPDVVAVVLLHGFSREEPPQAMIAYTVDGAYEGRGFASEAVERVVRYARDERRLTMLTAHFEPANARSERLLQRLGFRVVQRTPVIPGFEKLMRVQNVAALQLT